jgi:hypothetical protein
MQVAPFIAGGELENMNLCPADRPALKVEARGPDNFRQWRMLARRLSGLGRLGGGRLGMRRVVGWGRQREPRNDEDPN